MSIFDHMKKNNSRELIFIEEASLSLKAIIAIDSIVLGPANASAKFCNYETEDEAISDALDLAYFNSLRAALLRRSLGGGSIVLWGNPKEINSEMYFRALGIFLNKWNGKLFMTKSNGVSYEDMNYVLHESKFVLGMEESYGGHGKLAVSRTEGLLWGIKAAVKHKLNTNNLKGLKIIVQGVGDLGSLLVKKLIQEEAEIIITDKVYDKIKIIQDAVNDIKIVRPEDIYRENCDIFCNCATDKLITKEIIKDLNCKILIGSSNSILNDPNDEKLVTEKGILYIPGYIVNSGDIIQLANEVEGYGKEKLEKEIINIYYNTLDLIKESELQNKLISVVSITRAEEYLRQVSQIKMLK